MAVLKDGRGLGRTAVDGLQRRLLTFIAGNDDEGSMGLFFQGVVDHVKGVIGHHRSLVDDNCIVRPDLVINHVLLVGRNRNIKKSVDCISLQVQMEFFPVVSGKKTQGSAHSNRVFLFDQGVDEALHHLSLPSPGAA